MGGKRGWNHSSREARGDMRSQGSFIGQLVTGVSSECDERERRGWETAFVPS